MKLNEITNPHAEIEALLDKYKIENYTIQHDGTVDVNGNVYFRKCDFKILPIKFGTVTGYFYCVSCDKLESLDGTPSIVGGSFSCSFCDSLKTLVGAPSSVGGNFGCAGCKNLASLNGAPDSVGEDFNCTYPNKLISFTGFKTKFGGVLFCTWKYIKTGGISLMLSGCKRLHAVTLPTPFKIIEKYLGRPDDIFECQVELLEAGYEEYAQI